MWLCSQCKIETERKVTHYPRGEHRFVCLKCDTGSPLYNANGIQIDEKEFRDEVRDWK